MKNGVDLSHYQQVNWDKLKTDFVIAKCTEGLTFKDPKYQESKKECRDRGITFGSYHFFRDVDPVKQAEFFVENVGTMGEGEMLALDFEIHIVNPVEKCDLFLKRVEELTGYKSIIYMYSSLATLPWDTSYPLWIADPASKPRTGVWKDYLIWQYGQKFVDGAGFVDVDYFNDNYFKPAKPMLTIYSQQDPRWANKKLGSSNFTIGRYGCTVTSITMGKNFLAGTLNTPDVVANALNFTADGLILWNSLSKVGLRLVSRIQGRNEPAMNQALADPNKFCIVQVNSNHWCLIIGRKLPLLGYRIADPWFGDKAYTSRYKNNITGCAIIEKA